METISLFDLSITNTTLQQAVCLILKYLSGQQPVHMYFINAHCINLSRRDPDYFRILQNGDYLFADGIGMQLAALLHNCPLCENVNGTDMYPLLLDALEGSGYRIFLLGGDPGVTEAMQARALETHANLLFCGSHHGFFSPEENPSIVQRIRDTKPDLLLVAMGVPHQEKWIANHLKETGALVGIGVGGLFNFYSGRIPRAPWWMRKIGLEWVHRLLMEPGRMWKRYLIGNFIFLYYTIRDLIKTVFHKK